MVDLHCMHSGWRSIIEMYVTMCKIPKGTLETTMGREPSHSLTVQGREEALLLLLLLLAGGAHVFYN